MPTNRIRSQVSAEPLLRLMMMLREQSKAEVLLLRLLQPLLMSLMMLMTLLITLMMFSDAFIFGGLVWFVRLEFCLRVLGVMRASNWRLALLISPSTGAPHGTG